MTVLNVRFTSNLWVQPSYLRALQHSLNNTLLHNYTLSAASSLRLNSYAERNLSMRPRVRTFDGFFLSVSYNNNVN